MKLWELNTEKIYHASCGIVEWIHPEWILIENSYGVETDKVLKDRYNWEDILEMEFEEINPTPEPKKLYAYKNNCGKYCFRDKQDDSYPNNDEDWSYERAPEYDIVYKGG